MEPYKFACLKGKPYMPNFCEGLLPCHDLVEMGKKIRGKGNLGKKKSESHKNNMRGSRPSMDVNRNARAIDPSKRTPQQQKKSEQNQQRYKKAKKVREGRAAFEQMPAAKKQRMKK